MALTVAEFRPLLALNRHKISRYKPSRRMPLAQERRYDRRLRAMQADALAMLKPELEKILNPSTLATDAREFFRPFFRTDAGEIGEAIDRVEAKFWKKWTRARMANLVKPIAGDVTKTQATAANDAMRPVVGVDVFGEEPWLADSMEGFVERNVALIKTIPQRFFDEVEATITQEVNAGERWSKLSETIESRFSVSESRAKLIARDQVTKYYGELSRQRNKSIGITRERWRTQNDNRVRDDHVDLEGLEYDIEKPPLGGPGYPIQCRCFGEPIISTALET